MHKYKTGKALGDGAFGSVTKAINEQTGELVAIKRMKQSYNNWQQCISLNEIKSLARLHHPNIINLHELIKQDNQLYFVFEFMERNVYQLMQEQQLEDWQIRNIVYQTLQALAYMHRHGYFHRDLKPENLLEMAGTVKIADFGLVREIRARPPFTEYVSTRWYRAPEMLLRSHNYNSPIDMFAIGAIMAELYRRSPLFPGSTERDQLYKILQVLGTPSKDEWSQGYKLASSLNIELPQYDPVTLGSVIPQASPAALSLLKGLMQVNPHKRMTAQQALQHEYFRVQASLAKPPQMQGKTKVTNNEDNWVKHVRYRPGQICRI